MGATALVVPVADLINRPGARRHEHRTGELDGFAVVASSVPAGTPVDVDVVLEWVHEGVLATGKARTAWVAECRRCLRAVEGEAVAEFRELYEPHATEGETYPLKGDRIDLSPLARESLLLALPLAPLCREDCRGLCPTCGADLNAGDCDCPPPAADSRWAALEGLRFDDGDQD